MASAQGPGFIDKHIEKVVLAVCLALLLFAIQRWGIGTPRRVLSPAGEVEPKQVDKSILLKADQLQKRIEAAQPTRRVVPAYMEELKDFQVKFLAVSESTLSLSDGTPSSEGIQTPVDLAHGKGAPTLPELIAVIPAPAAPLDWAGEEIILKSSGGKNATTELLESTVWRAATWFPWTQLQAKWREMLNRTTINPQVVALRYVVEIQQRQSDGTWKNVNSVVPFRLPYSDGTPVVAPKIPAFTGTNGEDVRDAFLQYYDEWMIYMLQPGFYQVLGKTQSQPWSTHFPLAELDREFPIEADVKDPRDGDRPPDGLKKPPTLQNRIGEVQMPRTPRIPSRKESDRYGVDPRLEMDRYERGRYEPGREPGRIPPVERKPRRRPPSRTPKKPVVEKEVEVVAEVEEPLEVPDIARQLRTGKILMWFHAMGLEYNKDYRCRFKVVLVNPLLTYTRDLSPERAADATVATVESPFSPWSKPVRIQRDVEYYITGGNPTGKNVTVTVFTKVLGQCVLQKVNRVQAGQGIGSDATVVVVDPISGKAVQKNANFRTGAIMVDYNFQKSITLPSGRTKDNAIEVIYLDSDGQLKSRILYRDRNAPAYRALLDEADRVRRSTSGANE